MNQKTVYQYDIAGLYVGPVMADKSPLEENVYLLPARCTETPPPEAPDGFLPRWNGVAWSLAQRPKQKTEQSETVDPVEKLKKFLEQNPDVASLIA
jgi:hypothetical protein